MARRTEPKKLGRPQNDALLDTLIKKLEGKPQTIKQLAQDLDMPKRTAYRYIELATQMGLQVVKLGFTRDAPYFIMSKSNARKIVKPA